MGYAEQLSRWVGAAGWLPRVTSKLTESVKEPRDARRRRELIEATITSIARHGLSRTTVAKVAKIAGLSTGIVNFYFHSKQALLLATLEHVDREFELRQQETLERAGEDPVQLLEAMIEVDFDPEVCDRRRIAVWAAFWGEASGRADYMRVCGDRGAAMEQRIVKLFEKIASGGSYPHTSITSRWGALFITCSPRSPRPCSKTTPRLTSKARKATLRGFLASVFPAEFSAFGPHTSVLNAHSRAEADPERPSSKPYRPGSTAIPSSTSSKPSTSSDDTGCSSVMSAKRRTPAITSPSMSPESERWSSEMAMARFARSTMSADTGLHGSWPARPEAVANPSSAPTTAGRTATTASCSRSRATRASTNTTSRG